MLTFLCLTVVVVISLTTQIMGHSPASVRLKSPSPLNSFGAGPSRFGGSTPLHKFPLWKISIDRSSVFPTSCIPPESFSILRRDVMMTSVRELSETGLNAHRRTGDPFPSPACSPVPHSSGWILECVPFLSFALLTSLSLTRSMFRLRGNQSAFLPEIFF